MNPDSPTPHRPAPAVPPPFAGPLAPHPPDAPGRKSLISAVRRRQERQLWLQGALYGAASAVVLLAASGFVAHLSAGLGRALLIAGPVAFAGVFVALGVFLTLVRVGDDDRTARLLARRLPELSYDVLAGVELERALGASGRELPVHLEPGDAESTGGPRLRSGRTEDAGPSAVPLRSVGTGAGADSREPAFSHELARAFLRRLDERTARLDVRRAVDGHPSRRAALVLAGVALVAGTLVWGYRRPWRAGIAAATASTPRDLPSAHREPITGDVALTYRYPAYTGLPPRTAQGTNGEVTAPAGTEVQLKTRADRDVARADLVLDGKRIPLVVSGARDLAGTFLVEKAGAYHFAFYARGDRPIAVGPDVPVHVEADAAPQVRLVSPVDDLELDPGETASLRYDASDDYGLSALELVFRVAGSPDEQRLPLAHDEGRTTRGQYTWDLSAVKLRPGQEISYYLEARDNDEVSGKKKGVSRTQALKLYSAAEHRRAAVQRAEELWDRLVAHLADRLEGADRAKDKTVATVSRGHATDAAGNQLAADFGSAVQTLGRERDAPDELVVALVNIAQGLRPRVLGTTSARQVFLRLAATGSADPSPGRALTSAAAREISEAEKDVLYLEALLDRQKLLDLKELGQELQRDRRELASLIEEYKKTPDPKLQESILRDVEAMRRRIAELMQRMAELAKGIRDEHLNQEALAELMQDKNLSGALDDVERLVREGKADEALAKLQELAMQMDEMLQNLDEAEDQGAEDYPELAKKFQDFMDQLEKTKAGQERVAQETRQVRDQQRERLKERLAQRGQALKDELIRKADEVMKDYQSFGPDRLTPRADKPLEEAVGELDNVKNALKVDDFDLAAEAAARAEAAAGELKQIGEQQRQLDQLFQNPPDAKRQSRELVERLAKDAATVEDLSHKLQQLFPQPGSALTEADKQRLKGLAGDQRQLEQAAKEMQQKMDEMSQMAPLFGEEANAQMDQVGQKMGSAAQKVEGRDPARGYGDQKAALEQLSQLEKQMRQGNQGKGKRGKGLPLPMFAGPREGGQGRNHEKIEIPDPDQFQAPKEFRKDLLDAMKQGAPDKYKDQVKRYYEELVR